MTHAEAEAWCAAFAAQVDVWTSSGGPLYWCKVAGFHAAVAVRLEDAVAHLDGTVADWCDGPAAKGPTGKRLDEARAALAAWRGRQ
jgi:hypothetical protein